MLVLVDTSVWSLALRRQPATLNEEQTGIREELAELIREARVQLVGPVRQELLSGIRDKHQYQRLRQDLRAFVHPIIELVDYEEAATVSNHCRSHGLSGSSIDFLLCAIAMRRNWHIFTTDTDFVRYAKHLPLRLHKVRNQSS